MGYDGMFGKATFEQGVHKFLAPDVLGAHLGPRTRNRPRRHAPGEGVARVLEALKPMDDKMRGPRAFGDKIEPPPNADVQTRLLCFLGRRP